MQKSRLTPMMCISIILTLGILIARYSYDYITTCYWQLTSMLILTIALCLKRHIRYQSYAIYLCILCIGGCITSAEIDKSKAPVNIKNYDELPSMDKMLIEAQNLRNDTEKRIQQLQISDQDYAIIAAMSLGDKSALDQETKDNYSISGASHVLAVSGLHISIIFQAIIMILGGKRKTTFSIAISIIAIWAYIFLIGMPASAIRAATMISIYSFALLAKKEALSVNNLAFAYVIMLFINPLYLFDISFQMSFVAVLSILTIYPLIAPHAQPRHIAVKWIWNLFCVSLSAQIGTFPLIAYYFGRFSCYGAITSFVAIPGACLILYLSVLLLILMPLAGMSFTSMIATSIIQIIAKSLIFTTQFLNTTCKAIATFPGSSIEDIHISKTMLLVLYGIIISSYYLLKQLQRR